jgi:probable H4MPT-linked C1 transfer pathway protein
MVASILGLDIGGANLKAAHSQGALSLVPHALWKDPAGLPGALETLIEPLPPFDTLAVTMTGELCDCFETKRQGVNAILDAVETLARQRPVRVWRNDGRFVDLATARKTALQVAAANWLALAVYAGRFAPTGSALLLDIGSTTADIVPLHNGKPVPRGRTDPERLRHQELVYTGVRRTPLCALLGCKVAAEVFATTLDVYLVLGALPEDPSDHSTADGRPATKAAAQARLARMLCADLETSTEKERVNLANLVLLRQVHELGFALKHVAANLPSPPATVLLSGLGEFLARCVLKEHQDFSGCGVVSLAEKLGPAASEVACALALWVLALEGR